MSAWIRVFTTSTWLAFGAVSAHADVDLSKPPKEVLSKTPIAFVWNRMPPIVDLTLWGSVVREGDIVGQRDDGLFCTKYGELYYSKRSNEILMAIVTRAFNEEAAKWGYRLNEPASMFEQKGAPEFRIGATLLQWDQRVCGASKVKGRAYASVKWEVLSVRRNKVIYSASLESSFASSEYVTAREFDQRSALAIVDALLAEQGFVDAIRADGTSEVSNAPAAQTN